MNKEIIPISGMSSEYCAGRIERELKRIPGVSSARVNLHSSSAIVYYDGAKTRLGEIYKRIESLGYMPLRHPQVEAHDEKPGRNYRLVKLRREFSYAVLISAFLLFWIFLAPKLIPEIPAIAYFLGSALLAGILNLEALKNIWHSLSGIREHRLNSGILSFASAIILYISGLILTNDLLLFYSAVVVLLIKAEWLFTSSVLERIFSSLKRLLSIHPVKAVLLTNEKETEVNASQLQPGDLILVKPGQKIPADGIVVEGSSTVDESVVTGESIPVEKKEGYEVLAGTVNQNGTLKCRVTQVGNSTLIGQITSLVQEVQNSGGKLSRYSEILGLVILAAAITSSVYAYLTLLPLGMATAIGAATSLLLASSPFLASLSLSITISCALSRAAAEGILFRDESSLEKLATIDTVVFDKTGTLTKGKLAITDIIPLIKSDERFGSRKDEREILEYAAIAEKNSGHTIASSIIKMAEDENISVSAPYFFEEIPGEGIVAKHSLKTILLGNRKLMSRYGITIEEPHEGIINKLESDGKTVLILSVDKTPLGLIAFEDALREEAAEVVKALQKMGKKIVILTGDNRNTSFAIGKRIGIYEVISDVLPKEKSFEIQKLRQGGRIVAMVGDGINDAPALSSADVGIAFGCKSQIAVQSGHVLLLKSDLRNVVHAIEISSKCTSSAKSTIALSMLYHSAAIGGILISYSVMGTAVAPVAAAAACIVYSVFSLSQAASILSYKFRAIGRAKRK